MILSDERSALQGPRRPFFQAAHYSGSLESVMAGVRRAVAELDRTLPVYDAQSIEDVMREANRSDRFTTSLLTAFSFLAMLLAALGTYGVIAQGVSDRTQELGVRIALGARARDVRRMVLLEGLVLVGVALPFALVGIVAAGKALRGLLFEVGVGDPVTVSVAAVTLGLVALIACYVPALRASRVDPVSAMRAN